MGGNTGLGNRTSGRSLITPVPLDLVRNEILYYPLYRITYEAIKIEEKKIPDAEFEINRAKTISPKQE